jgi:signal transduction histidine kinase
MSVAIRVALETDTFVVVVEARHDGAGTAPIAAGDSQITAAAQRVQAIGGSFDLLSSAANTSRITLRVGINQL